MFIINNAFADEVVRTQNFSNVIGSLVPLLIFFCVFYFLLVRPSQQKDKEHKEEISKLKKNDKVITSSGVYGVVKQVKEKTTIIEISKDVEIEIVSEMLNLIKKDEKKTK